MTDIELIARKSLGRADREFIESLAMIRTLAETPLHEWPPLEFLQRKIKEIINVK